MISRIRTASREEYLGFAVEDRIRGLEQELAWYRRQRRLRYGLRWHDWERPIALELRNLYRLRRQAVEAYRTESDRIEAAWERAKADLDRVQLTDPEYPLIVALATDENMARATWGDR